MSYCLSERYEATERQCQWYWQNIDNIGVLNASMNIFHDGKNCPESSFPSILCVLILGKSLHKPHWPLKWSRHRQQVDRTPDHQVWLGPYGYIYFLYVKKQHISAVKQAGKVWLRCTALLEIERMRILWAAKDLEASSLLINLWQEVCLSALCAMLLIYMLIWIQRIAGISRMASFQSLSIPLQKQFRNMFGNAKPLGMYFFWDRWFILLKISLSVPQP